MRSQVKELASLGLIDGSFISLDSTSIEANTSKNNSKSFDKNRFDKSSPSKSDKDCRLGVRTASNTYNEKKRKTLPCGNPICDAGFAMIRDGRQYLKGSIKQKFRCPFYLSKDNAACTCAHPKYFNGARKRGCIKYISTGTDYRSSINRDSPYFKSIFSSRTESERYNSRWKNLNTDRASVRSLTAIQNLNTVGHICLLAAALAAVKSGKTNCSRSLKGFIKSV
jgi:hypothetical protein